METFLYIEIAVLVIIFIFQIKFFLGTCNSINDYKHLFENSECFTILSDNPIRINVDNEKIIHPELKYTFSNINKFLTKTKGSVEGSREIFAGLFDRLKYKYEDKIESQLSAPLYLGLCGTLIGICFGLFNLVTATSESNIADLTTESINGLFKSVGYAIFVSLIGLVFVIINTNFNYKSAKVLIDISDAELRTKLELELLPNVSESTVSAIYDLKNHLSSFNAEFGKNLVQYKDNFSLIGENLKAQERVINLLSSTSFVKTVKEIADLLEEIKEVSENFDEYKDYQKELIQSFDKTLKITDTYGTTLNNFETFNTRLENLSSHIESSTLFNKKFANFLEKNFPEDESAKEIYAAQWKEVGNALIKDIAINSQNITKYFSDVNNEVGKFASSNKNLFDNFVGFKQALEVMIKNSEMSYVAFKKTQNNMDLLQKSIMDNNKTLKELTMAVKEK